MYIHSSTEKKLRTFIRKRQQLAVSLLR